MWCDVGLVIVLISLFIFGFISSVFCFIVQLICELIKVQSEVVGIDFSKGGNEIDQLCMVFEVFECCVWEKEKFEEIFFGCYQVFDVFGEGVMGMVFCGWDFKFECFVVFKMICFDWELLEVECEKLVECLV